MESTEASRPVALVAGASGGIGRACAEALASAGELCNIAVHYNSCASAANELAQALSARYGVRAAALHADLGKAGAAEQLVEQTAAALGAPSILIHAAGHYLEKPITFTKPEEFDALFEVHVFSAAALTKAMARHLRKSERGRIVYIGSLAGCIGLGHGAAYAAAKGALDGLCKSFALEAARWKTTVNVVAPGFVDTPMTAPQDPKRREASLKGIPLGRYASSGEVASLAAYLCSTQAAYITGQTILMDGGASLG
jgi:3-oxoacyl-[acyl-carrier protein] reductase